eukprot:gene10074-13538_t
MIFQVFIWLIIVLHFSYIIGKHTKYQSVAVLGSFSLFSPNAKNRQLISTINDFDIYTENDREYGNIVEMKNKNDILTIGESIFNDDIHMNKKIEPNDLSSIIIKRFMNRSDSLKLKQKGNLLKYKDRIVLSIPDWLLGYRNYAFQIIIQNKQKNNHNNKYDKIEIHFLSPKKIPNIGQENNKNRLRFIFTIHMDEDGILILTKKYSSKGNEMENKNKKINQIAEILGSYIKESIEKDITTKLAHTNLLNEYTKESKLAGKIAKKKELDMIINPEKYKTKSSTVRRVSSGANGKSGGNGRYKPSAAAQARRTVKSK